LKKWLHAAKICWFNHNLYVCILNLSI
jgi:hypothetical protein